MKESPSEKIINTFIARKPQLAVDFLKAQGVPLSSAPTLKEITTRLYERYYQNDKGFNTALGQAIAYGDNIGFVITASIIVAIVGTGVGAGFKSAQFNKDKRIAENLAQVEKNAAGLRTQAQLDAERAGAVATSVADYKASLEAESTQRRKSAIIFVAGIAVVGMVAALIFRK
jgi:hypothetical protein